MVPALQLHQRLEPHTMSIYGISFAAALLVSVALVLTQRWHGRFSLDSASGVQHHHSQPTSRVGGIGIMLGLAAAWSVTAPQVSTILGQILLAGIPAFVFGLLEDITKRVGVLPRLVATMFSGALAWMITGVAIQDTGVQSLDWLLSFMFIAVLFTAFAVGGLANAINIIDGFNGLAGGAVAIMLGAIGWIALSVGDSSLATVCFLCATVTLGFFAINWPMGKLFLGDGGAYLIGFVLGWIAVLLPMRNLDINAWASLLVCAYPVLEVAFSVQRRMRRSGHHPGKPDKIHLHHLVHRRIVCKLFPRLSPTLQNGLTSPACWLATALPAAWAVAFAQNMAMLALGFVLALVAYAAVYTRLSQFRWCFSARTLKPEPSKAVA